MNPILVGLIVLVVAAVGLRWFVNANPSSLVSSGRKALIALGVMLALALLVTGRVGLAVAIGFGLLALSGSGFLKPSGKRARGKSQRPRSSMVRSAALEMELDHDTGKMTGRVLAGTFEGRDLDSLGLSSLGRLAAEIAGDAESRALLEAYLDRRMPRWREHMKADAAAGERGPAYAGAMSEEEAYQILGLQKGAGEPEIRAAHRRLMKKVHPDHGGSTFLAARINEAKDRLLSKHR
nr:DnaJ domain-containing protein [Chthonobacter rhizosphaerae]